MTHNTYLHHPHLSKLFSSGQKLVYKKGEIIQHANEPPKGVYFVTRGYVREYTLSNSGKEHFNIIYGSGEIFSFLWAYLDARQNVFREAHTDVTVYLLGEDIVRLTIDEDVQLQKEVNALLMLQMYFLKLRVENLTFSNAYDKVAYCMLYFAGRYGRQQPNGSWYVGVQFRHQQVADALSMTRETASRMIARMEKNQLIRQDKNSHFIVINPLALADTIGVENVLGMWPNLRQP